MTKKSIKAQICNDIILLYQFLKEPQTITHIDFIYFTTMQILQLNQSNLLLTPLYAHKLQFISNKLHLSSSSHDQLPKLVFLFSH